MKMKHLWIFVLAVLSTPVKADPNEPDITKYTLKLEDKNDHFKGELTLTPKTTITTSLVLDIGSNLKIEKCTHSGGTEWTQTQLGNGKVKIEMPGRKGNDIIIIEYKGEYVPNGLFKEKIANNDYYFASFANGGIVNVLPCEKDGVADFDVKFKTASSTKKLESNIKRLGDSEVRLQDIVFVYGTFTNVISSGPPTQIALKGVEHNGTDTLKAKTFSVEVLKKMNETLPPKLFSSKKMQQYLFPRSTVREINGKYFSTQSLKNYLLADNIGALREQSIRTDLIQHLTQNWFDAGRTTDKWLNAGLSAFLAYYALDKWPTSDIEKKKFRALDQLVVDQQQLRAFEADGFASSLPLKHFNTITTTYDGVLSDPILYAKGVSIMRSVMAICGKDKFENVLKEYVNKSDPIGVKDFAGMFKDCFSPLKVEDVETFFEKWHELPGYPVVHVMMSNGSTGSFRLSQDRFCWGEEDLESVSWTVPISYVTNAGETGDEWLRKSLNLDLDKKCSWIIINNDIVGYYRVNYDMKIWDAIITQLEKDHTAIDEINRAQIIDDIFSFARSVRNFSNPVPDYKMAMRLFNYLKKEKGYIPLKAAFNAIEFLDSALKGTEPHSSFMAHVKLLVKELYPRFGLKTLARSESHVTELLARVVSSWACRLDIEECVQYVKDFWENNDFSLDNKESKPKEAVLEILNCTGIRNGFIKWKTMASKVTSEKDPGKRLLLIKSMGCTKKKSLISSIFTSLKDWKMEDQWLEVTEAVLSGDPENAHNILQSFDEKLERQRIVDPGIEKFIQLLLRNLNPGDVELLDHVVQTYLPKDNAVRRQSRSVGKAVDSWKSKKMPLLAKALKSGEITMKPIALMVLLSIILSYVNFIG